MPVVRVPAGCAVMVTWWCPQLSNGFDTSILAHEVHRLGKSLMMLMHTSYHIRPIYHIINSSSQHGHLLNLFAKAVTLCEGWQSGSNRHHTTLDMAKEMEALIWKLHGRPKCMEAMALDVAPPRRAGLTWTSPGAPSDMALMLATPLPAPP